jgi:hypothetical protein
MKEQNYKNHGRILFSFHVLTSLAILALIIGSVRNLIQSNTSNLYSASLLVLVSLILLSLYVHTRMFALRAQDRAIRAEENLRHFALTGQLLDKRLSLAQVIALRFASDEEFVTLAQKAAEQKLSQKSIKQEIRQWRADNHRV